MTAPPSDPPPFADPTTARLAEELAAAGRRLAARGHCEATSSNYSARLGEGRFLVSRSGVDKHGIGPADFLLVDGQGRVMDRPGERSSAETLLHLVVYDTHPPHLAGAVLHVHSVSATVLSMLRAGAAEVRLRGYEMLKALAGVTTHEHEERVPILDNSQDMPALARAVRARLDEAPGAHGFLLAGHGLYTWGATVTEALRHVEAFDFLFSCALRRQEATS
jgi:methylthioribulose-1-phosphate dehydratase